MSRLTQLVTAKAKIEHALNGQQDFDLAFAAYQRLDRIKKEIAQLIGRPEIITYNAPAQSAIPHADFYRSH